MNPPFKKIILVDDDSVHNFISIKLLKKFLNDADAEITAFTDSGKSLQFIITLLHTSPVQTLLLLDLNMPVLNGWDVLDELDKLEPGLKHLLTIYILSSSIDPHDKTRAGKNPMVAGYLTKPLYEQFSVIFNNTAL